MGISIVCTSLLFMLMAFVMFNNDILSPTFMLSTAFFLGGLCVLLNTKSWSSVFHFNTWVVYAGGLLLSFIIEAIVKIILEKRKENVNSIEEIGIVAIRYNRLVAAIITLFSIVIFYVYLKEVIRVAYSAGFNGTGTFIAYSRRVILHNLVSEEDRISPVITQSYKILVASSYVFVFVLINNIKAKEVLVKDYIILLFNPLLSCVGSILINGGRLRILKLLTFAVIVYYLIDCKEKGEYRRIEIRNIIRLLILAVLLLFFFKWVTVILGRGIEYSFLEYISGYYGGGIELFNKFIQNNAIKRNLFGEETFYHVYDFLRKLHLINFDGETALEYNLLGTFRDNVYTAYRRPYVDFGIIGMFLLHSITCLYFCVNHYKYIREYPYNGMDRKVLLYAYVYFALIFYTFDNFFYMLISLNEIVTIILCFIIFNIIDLDKSKVCIRIESFRVI